MRQRSSAGGHRGSALCAAAVATATVAVLGSCARQTTVVGVPPHHTRPVPAVQRSDTLTYAITFSDNERRQEFTRMFESFLERYRHATVPRDSVSGTVVVRLLPVSDSSVERIETVPGAGPSVSEQVSEERTDSLLQVRPVFGGSLVIYSDREFWDDNLSALVRRFPFGGDGGRGDDSTALIVSARQVGTQRIMLTISPSLRTPSGRSVSAFDLAAQWAAFVREQPSEGLALFRHVKGIQGYIRGQETVVPGIVVSGSETITLLLERPDSDALVRLATSRVVPPALGLGPYVVQESRGTSYVIAANRRGHIGPPYLERCTIVLGGDRNPLVTYSLRKYDCVVLTTRKDIEYARRTLKGDSRLTPLPAERYFLSLNCPTVEERLALRALVNPSRLLSGAAACEGEVVGALESDRAAVFVPPPAAVGGALLSKPVVILYRAGDPVSARIAEKLFAEFVQARLVCELRAAGATEYGRALVDRTYTVAIGWVGERVVSDRTEQLRLAVMWFGDRTDEPGRIAEGLEVPLFSVRRQLFCRSDVRFAGDTVADVYVQGTLSGKEQNHGGQ